MKLIKLVEPDQEVQKILNEIKENYGISTNSGAVEKAIHLYKYNRDRANSEARANLELMTIVDRTQRIMESYESILTQRELLIEALKIFNNHDNN